MAIDNLDTELNKLRINKSKKRAKGGGFGKFVVILILAGLGAGGYFWVSKANAALPVKTMQIQKEAVIASGGSAVLTAGGYIIPRDKIEVSSKIIGRVKEIYIEQGDVLKKGDKILEIEDEEYAAQVKIAEARVASLKARLAELKAGSRPQEIASAKSNVASAEATFKMREADLERLKKLAEEKIISAQEFDQMKQAYEVAKAALDSIRKNAELVVIGPRKEMIDAATAQLREAEANLEYARTQQSYTIIHAPIDGTVLEKLAEKGELVTNTNFGGTRGAKSSVVSMANLSDLQVELDINENDLPKVKMGQKCKIKLDSEPDTEYDGEVDEISPQADRQKATVQVKVKIVNTGKVLRPEVNARVTFIEEEKEKTAETAQTNPKVWIPRSAIVNNAEGQMVYLYLESQGTAVARKIKTGAESSKGVEITEGLIGTETLIVEPLDKIKDGMKVATSAS